MKLKDIVSIVTDYVANGSFASLREHAKYVGKEEGFARVIRLTDHNNKYDDRDAVYVDENSYNFLSKSKLSPGDIIVTNVGAYLGTVFQCPNLQIPMTLGPNSILIKPNDKVINKYLFYLLSSIYGHNKLLELISGSAMPKFNKTDLKNMEITIHPVEVQQHIVNTIGSVDDLIENYQLQIQSLFSFGLFLINQLNESNILINLSTIAKLEKGIEVGSSIYQDHKTDESIKYLRVGDLLSEGSTYIPQDESKNEANEDDILIAFDGAPGRNTIGLSGSFSSGISFAKIRSKVSCILN